MPYWRLSSYYFFYFAALGALVPYWGLYLDALAFNAVEIGQLMAILMGTKIIAPYLWGWLGDHLGHRMRIVRMASLLSATIFTAMFWADTFWAIALVMILFSFFWNASLPQFEVVTFSYLGDQVRRYARIRVWGSVGFILAVLLLGYLIDEFDPRLMIPAVLILYAGIWLASLTVSDPDPEAHPQNQPSLLKTLAKPAILAFFAAVFLMQAGHGPYYVFYSLYLTGQGYSETVVGGLWALGVLAEVVLFMFMHRVLERLGGRLVLQISLFLAAIRWILIAYFAESLPVLLFAQLLHAATFGSFHASAIHLVHHYFPGKLRGRGQALYSSLSFGAGGAVGSLVSGFTWEYLGSTHTLLLASSVSLIGGFLVWRFIDQAHDH